jgi:hypothetical protein
VPRSVRGGCTSGVEKCGGAHFDQPSSELHKRVGNGNAEFVKTTRLAHASSSAMPDSRKSAVASRGKRMCLRGKQRGYLEIIILTEIVLVFFPRGEPCSCQGVLEEGASRVVMIRVLC